MNKVKNINFFWISVFSLLLLIIFIISYSPFDIISKEANKGEINLSQLEHNTIVNLGGEWLFYNNLLIQDLDQSKNETYVMVPHLFEKNNQHNNHPYGVATYKLLVHGLQPDRYYGIHIINEVSAYRLTVNGEDIITAGSVGYTKDTHEPEMKGHVGYFKPNDNGNAEFLMEISNFSYNYGGFWKKIKIGHQETVTTYVNHQTGVDILSFGMMFVFALFFLVLFRVKKEQKSLLFFSMFSLLIALRTILTNNKQIYDFVPNISWDIGTRLEFLIGYLLLPTFILFLLSLDYIKNPKFVHTSLYLFIVASFILTLITPNEIYATFLEWYKWLCVFSIPIILFTIIQGIRKKRTGSLYILIGALGFLGSALIDFYGKLDYYVLSFGTFFMLLLFSMVVINDFFELKQKHDYLENAVMKDPLTGLKNRFYLNSLIDQGLPISTGSYKYYIFFFDLNKFKIINDTYGHNTGDAILVESARRIERYFSAESDIVCRFGGDEFIAITLSKESQASIHKLAKNIINSFKEPFICKDNQHFLSVSIGIVEYTGGDDLEKVINDSDTAMYEAKKQQTSGIMMVSKTDNLI